MISRDSDLIKMINDKYQRSNKFQNPNLNLREYLEILVIDIWDLFVICKLQSEILYSE